MSVSALSVIAQAQTIDYSFQMPSTGYETSRIAYKADTEDQFYLRVSRLGWVEKNDGFVAWVINTDGSQISKDVSFTSTGLYKKAYKGNNASYYVGNPTKLRMKTDWKTNHPCDVNGKFTP
ncbi:MAG: hypothetical protein K5986_09025 [Clostridium sp.]|nr:hypothetical protein [Clostridium sp.]